MDALLQQNAISIVIQMATALALQWLANFVAGQPRSEHNEVLGQLANASQQIRTLTHATHAEASSWYGDRDSHPHALLIHPDEFTTYINLELLPALVFPGELSLVKLVRTDPFHIIPWPPQGPTVGPSMSTRDSTIHMEHA